MRPMGKRPGDLAEGFRLTKRSNRVHANASFMDRSSWGDKATCTGKDVYHDASLASRVVTEF